tara:strand:- start:257 stop:1387 length:1131 start_codon:yes stop_codon:yes gene_type:complete
VKATDVKNTIGQVFESESPRIIESIVHSYYSEIEDGLQHILGDQYFDDLIPESQLQLAFEIIRIVKHEGINSNERNMNITLRFLNNAVNDAVQIFHDPRVIALCQNICYFDDQDTFLNALISKALPAISKMYVLSKRITHGHTEISDTEKEEKVPNYRQIKLAGLIVTFTLLHNTLSKQLGLSERERDAVDNAVAKISDEISPDNNESPNLSSEPNLRQHVKALESLKENLETLTGYPDKWIDWSQYNWSVKLKNLIQPLIGCYIFSYLVLAAVKYFQAEDDMNCEHSKIPSPSTLTLLLMPYIMMKYGVINRTDPVQSQYLNRKREIPEINNGYFSEEEYWSRVRHDYLRHHFTSLYEIKDAVSALVDSMSPEAG